MARRPIRRFRGNLVPFDWTSAIDFDALDVAVRLARRPNTARIMRAAPPPKGVLTLFQILGGAEGPTALAARRLRRNPAFVRSIAAFYVERVLWTGNPDHYRVLGVGRHAAQEQIDENLQAALAWLMPYVGTARWEGDFASAVAAAGRAIGTEDDRLAYDLAAWSDMAAAAPAPAPRKTIRRTVAVGVASLAWFTVMGGNFLASGIADAPTAGRPVETSTPAEADAASIAVVRVKVVNGQDPVAAVPAPEPQPAVALHAALDEPPAASAPMDLLSGAATPPPDFKTAFQREDAAPEGDADVAATMPPETLAALAADAPTAVRPEETSTPPEADASIAVVQAKVVNGQDPVAAVPAPEPQPAVVALLAESDQPPATSAPMDLLSGVATPPRDFSTAFEHEGAGPEGDADVAATAPAESLPTLPASTAQPPTAVAGIDEAGGATSDAASEPLAAPTLIASLADGTEAAPAATAKLSPSPRPVEPPKVLALPAKQEPPALVATAAPPVAASPSFKCSRARTEVELAICGDPALAEKDRELAQLYRHVRGSLAGSSRASATSQQMSWLKDRDSCGGSATCILDAYNSRLRELATQLN